MKDQLVAVAELNREGRIGEIIGYQVEEGHELIGTVSDLIRDKYGRLSGIEIELESKSGNVLIAVPYQRLSGIDVPNRTVIIANR